MTRTTAAPTDPLELLKELALDLNAPLAAADRYRRLVAAVRRALPCDATVLLGLEGEALVPLASHGLVEHATARRFVPREHPRLAAICAAEGPTVFPPDTALPDPFDGLLAGDLLAEHSVHACLGCPLRVDGELVGALTADARDPRAFDGIDRRLLAALGELAGAAVRTARLIEALERQAARTGLVAQDLMREAQERRGGHLLGASPIMQRLRDEVELVARAGLTVLVTGETGVGKELVARALHASSPRRDQPLIYVNCAALPEAIAESELFGHVRGAFTGAESHRPGKLEVADGGTLFLDEVGELPLRVQGLLLRALQEGEIQRVGADRPHRVDVRVVAATNRDLEAEVAAGRFRADLFHRLAVYRLHVPPLRERRADVPLLAGFFCDLARRRLGCGPVRMVHEAQERLRAADWPGNVRELENVVSRAVLRASARAARGTPVVVTEDDLGLSGSPGPAPSAVARPDGPPPLAAGETLSEAVEAYKRRLVARALEEHRGSWAAAARALGMHRSNLHHLAKRLGLR